MDITLKKDAERILNSINDLIVTEQQNYEKYSKQVAKLTWELQNNPDLQTDLSENASYQVTKENRDIAQSMCNTVNAKIASLQKEFEEYEPSSFAKHGTTLELSILDIDDTPVPNEKFIIRLVNHESCKAVYNLVSMDSPVGVACIGKHQGDIVTAIAPGGRTRYKIERMY